jgi:hypothetical protein
MLRDVDLPKLEFQSIVWAEIGILHSLKTPPRKGQQHKHPHVFQARGCLLFPMNITPTW